MHEAKYQTLIWFCMRSTANDESLELRALAVPVSL